MTKRDELNELYGAMLRGYPGGLSNTSTRKFDDIKRYISDWFGLPYEEIYATGAGTRAGNLEVRLSQGLQAIKHTKLGLGFLKADNKKQIDTRSDSAVVTVTKFLGRGKATYDAIGILVEYEKKLFFTRILEKDGEGYFELIKKEYPEIKQTTINIDAQTPSQPESMEGLINALKEDIANPSSSSQLELLTIHKGNNLIYMGPPGTGKSFLVEELTREQPSLRTTFHPEYTYADFIGSYQPVVGFDDTQPEILGIDGKRIKKPINYFEFVPGPFILAVKRAIEEKNINSENQVFLIIEEINRGDCAAIFGETFQLLDRDDSGQSKYGITLKTVINQYFKENGINIDIVGDGKFYIPSNLSLVATMNTSDQSLIPMDSAFMRRWDFIPCPIDYGQLIEYTAPDRPKVNDGLEIWDWITILEELNNRIIKDHMEDKQIGPWFIKPNKHDGEVSFLTICNKLFYYLWHDVFKEELYTDSCPFKMKTDTYSFDKLYGIAQTEGLAGVFKDDLINTIRIKTPKEKEAISAS